MGDIFDEYEAELLAKANTPEAKAEEAKLIARNLAKGKAEFKRGLALGWYDTEGNPKETEEEE